MRLSEFIPPIFYLQTKEDQDKYKLIILDFVYFKTMEWFDNKLQDPAVQVVCLFIVE